MAEQGKYADYPHRRCIECDGIEDCPEPDVENDGMGTPKAPDYCPKAEMITNLIKARKNGTQRKGMA